MSTVEYSGYPGDHQLAYARPAFDTGGGYVVVDPGLYPGQISGPMPGGMSGHISGPMSGHISGPMPGHMPGPMLGQMSGPVTYGAGPPFPATAAVSSLHRGFGELLLATGGLIFFIASFLTWVEFSFGVSDDPCVSVRDPEIRATCEALSRLPASAATVNGWVIVLTSAASVLMILLSVAAAGKVAGLIPATPTTRTGFAVALVAVDVAVFAFFASYDVSLLGAALSEDALAQEGASVSPIAGVSLGIGFWLAILGLVLANTGLLVARASVEGRNAPTQPAGAG